MDNADQNKLKSLVFVDEIAPVSSPINVTKTSFDRWPFVAFALIFISFYAAVLMGWLRPIADMSMLSRLEPIIFVIIGFYFGRSPSVENENVLQEQKANETRRAEIAIKEREDLKKDFEVLSEKLKSAKFLLNEWPFERDKEGPTEREPPDPFGNRAFIQERIATVKQILSM